MRTLNIRGAIIFAGLLLAFALLGRFYFPSDTDVHFNVESGFYDEPVVLEMTCAVRDADIYYTTDGSIPTIHSNHYTGPIILENVEDEFHSLSSYSDVSLDPALPYIPDNYIPDESMMKANVIRAAAFWNEKERSAVKSATYFIGIERSAEYTDVPIISLITEEASLFDYETGIYTLGSSFDNWHNEWDENSDIYWWQIPANFHYRGHEWEREVSMEYMPSDGSSGFEQTIGMRIKGGASRLLAQKSFRLIARDEYGKDRIGSPIFDTNKGQLAEASKSFVLRSGGNDCNYAKIRDPLVQALSGDLHMDTQQSQPCVVFINGEYWGLYSVTEEYSEHHIETNYGIEKENTIIVKRGILESEYPEDSAFYEEMIDFISKNDMTIPENYRRAANLLDLDNFVDYTSLQTYVDNADCFLILENNWQMWRARTIDSSNPYGDGRWRMMLYDVDYCADLYGDESYTNENLSHALLAPGGEESSRLLPVLRSLYQNEDFRRKLVNALCDVRNIHFEPYRVMDEIDRLRSVYEPLMADSFRRFGPQWVLDYGAEQYCEDEIDRLSFFFENRYEVFPQLMQQALGLQEPAEALISCEGDGGVMVNHSVPDIQDDYTGLYFPDYPITLTAMETGEGRFVRWEAVGCTLSDPASATTEVSFTGDFSVQAIFD